MPLLGSWFWLIVALVLLIFLERWIHKHLQGIWLLVFRHPEPAMIVYSILMLPGVLLHEGSHWVVAMLLGARTGRFSIIPERMEDGTLRLGFVETERVDFLREALIGAAPLIAGSAAIIVLGYDLLGVGPVGVALARGDLLGTMAGIRSMTRASDFWLLVYFVFTISNSMLPSASDRRAWLPVSIAVLVIGGLLIYGGFGTVLLQTLATPVDAALRALASAFTITVSLDVVFAPLIWLVERGLTKVTGLKVEY